MPTINLSSSYTQNFDSLISSGSGTWTNDPAVDGTLGLSGWYTARTGTGTTIVANDGSSNTGALYSYGSTGSTDRALGSVGSGGAAAGNFFWGVRLVNNTASTIPSLNIAYTGEEWRNGGGTGLAQTVDFQYQVGATSLTSGAWTDFNALDFTSPVFSATAGALNGNLATNQSALSSTLSGLSLAPGQEIWLRWSDIDHPSSDHGLAIDNFSVSTGTVVPTLPTVTIAANPTATTEGSATPGLFTITRTGSTTSPLTVNFAVSGSATSGSDYTTPGSFATNSIVIPAGASSVDIAIAAIDDTIVEPVEDVSLILSTSASYNLGAANATVTINDNDTSVPLTLIHQIQGSGTTFNPAFGGTQTIEGVVVAAFPGASQLRGFYVQEENADADADSTTSEGIFVFDPNGLFSGAVGTKVRVTGSASEFTTTAANIVGTGNSSLTEFTSTSVVDLGATTLPTVTNVVLPVTDTSALERYEGMLVNISSVSSPLTVTETFKVGRFGQVGLSGGARLDQYTQVNTPSVSGYANYLANLQDNYIIVDDGSTAQNPDPEIFARGGQPLSASNTLRGGDTVASVTGVLDQRFEGYRVQTRTPVNFQPTNARETVAPIVGGNIKVGGFNVLNYFTDLDTNATISIPNGVSFEPRGANTSTEFTRQRDKIISAIATLNTDVLGVIEMENDGTKSIQNLVNGLNAVAGAGTYAFINDTALVNDPNPAVNAVGTDAIKVGVIYKPGSVTPVGLPLTYQESNPANPVFSRPPVAQTFVDANGGKFTVIVNHFKSKGSANSLPGDTDQGDGQGLSNATRVAQSQALLSFINTVKATSSDDDVLVIGDLNAYALEDPITTLTSSGLTNLFSTSSYSYQFNGQWGALDHALASSTLNSQVSGAAKWHINSDEPVVLDYNTEFKSAGQVSSFYNADPFRASDHDPLVVGLNLNPTYNVISGTTGRDTLTGTSSSDQITGFQGADTITTGSGLDRIVYTNIRDAGDIIIDFTVGSDKLVITQLLSSIGYSGTNAIADGYISFVGSGSNTVLQVDQDGFGAASAPRSFLTLNNVSVATINNPSNFVF
jgi:uncharacterized protein